MAAASTAHTGTTTVTTQTYAASDSPDVAPASLRPSHWYFKNASTSVPVLVSFDGTNNHVTVPPDTGLWHPRTLSKQVWFKVASGSAALTWNATDGRGAT